MPSYTSYLRQMAVLDADDNEIESWITVRGNHIPIKKGQSKEDAVKSFIEKKGGKEKGGDYESQGREIAKREASHEFKKRSGVGLKFTELGKGDHGSEMGEKKAEPKAKHPPLQKGQLRLHRDIDDRYAIIDPDGAYTFYRDGVKGAQNRSLKGQEGAVKELGEIGYKGFNDITTPEKSEKLAGSSGKESSVKNDLGKFADAYNKLYEDSDAFSYKPSDLSKEYNKAMHNPEFAKWVQEMSKERGDVFMSDREYHALLVVAKEKGLIKEKGKEAPKVTKVDAKKWNSPASDPWKSLYD